MGLYSCRISQRRWCPSNLEHSRLSTWFHPKKRQGSAILSPTIAELLARASGQHVTAQGWVRHIRRQKSLHFVSLFDGTSVSDLQVIINPQMYQGLTNGTSVRVEGILRTSPGPKQALEVEAKHIEILGTCDPTTYPVQKKEQPPEYWRQHAHFRPRTISMASMLRIRGTATKALRGYLDEQQFTEIQAPIITSNDCEGGGETFKIKGPLLDDFFGRPAYLTVSAQLHAELAVSAMSRVYTFAPTFRAENHHTSRHLAEFWMLEVELAFVKDLSQLLNFIEELLRETTRTVITCRKHELSKLTGTIADLERRWQLLEEPFERITYTEAVEILKDAKQPFEYPISWGNPLQSEHERYLADSYAKRPIFITDYPKSIKPFYMRLNQIASEEQQTVACTDLLFPHIGEVVGGSLREERLSIIDASIKDHGLNLADYNWYLDLRRFGSVPHAGFGLGFDRFIQYITGTPNIRDVVMLPRIAGTLYY